MCKYCELYSSSSDSQSSDKSFIHNGATLGSHPTRVLTKHENSQKHKFSIERYTLSRTNVNVYKQVHLALNANAAKEEQRNRNVVKKIFRCVDFLARQKWAVSENTEKLVRFVASIDESNSDLKQHCASASNTYLSSTSVTQMVSCISEFYERELLLNMNEKQFSLLADESTDMAHRSQLCIMARFGNSHNEIATHFLGFVNLEKATAEAIMTAVKLFLLAKNIDIGKIRFIALDGCNTMSGEHKGLERRIRHESPFALYVNCRNHRLALCLVHLIKKYPVLQEIDSLLISLWKLFEFSPQKMAVFKNIQSVYGKEPLTFLRAATTSSLFHLHACSRFVSRYNCILDTLDAIYDDRKDPEVYGIRVSATNKSLLAGTVLLCDILKPVNMLSLYLQQEDINFTTLPIRVKETTDLLHQLN